MIKYIENLLFEKTRETKSDILYAQWNFDKRIIPGALQAVSNLFPHYSLHDESHSISIVNNIVRIIGKDNLDELSAIDLWLILEASYYHDIGMVVSADKLNEAINSGEFPQFLKQIKQDSKNSLYETANLFDIVEGKIKFKDDNFSLEILDGIKYLLADFFRSFHSDRATEIIINPEVELSILSPRAIIPARIFKILAEICACHTKDFEEVYKLPFSEVGIDTEDAHPRYIACLLRIGDLLDLDNNRFSEVILRTLTKIPLDTLRHKSKHLSIERFRADRDKIEIKAKCFDYETASITQHWFNYLNTEISNQMTKWNDIVPCKKLGYLPTVGDLKVELLKYDLIDGKNKPKFTVNTDKALTLLKGAGLYEGDFQAIREILQNSVDATLIRIWLESKDANIFAEPKDKAFLEELKKFPITININSKRIDDGWKSWEISITDCGIGISSNDLKFLMNTGSSSNNYEKNKIIESMPKWMRPSGTFGIGFQSIFMLSDIVNIETKSFFDEKLQHITLYSPNSEKNGDILIQKIESNHSKKPGTKLYFNYKTRSIIERYSIKSNHINASKIANNYDPFIHESLDIELGQIFDEIIDFSHKCYIPVRLLYDNEPIESKIFEHKTFDYFEPDNSIELSIQSGTKEDSYGSTVYYKNQRVESDLSIFFLGFEINIHQDKASEVLTLNRNKVKSEYRNKLFSQFIESAFRVIISNFNDIFQTDEEKSIGSMFLNYYSRVDTVKKLDINPYNQWEKLAIEIEGKTIGFKQLLDDAKFLKICYNREQFYNKDTYKYENNMLEITLNGSRPSFEYSNFLFYKAQENFISFSIPAPKDIDFNKHSILFSKAPNEFSFSNDFILNILKQHRKKVIYSSRAFIPCAEEFNNLRIIETATLSYVTQYIPDNNIFIPYPKMLSPFVRKEDTIPTSKPKMESEVNEKLIDWVYDNRFNKLTTKDQIREAYKQFTSSFNLEEINDVQK